MKRWTIFWVFMTIFLYQNLHYKQWPLWVKATLYLLPCWDVYSKYNIQVLIDRYANDSWTVIVMLNHSASIFLNKPIGTCMLCSAVSTSCYVSWIMWTKSGHTVYVTSCIYVSPVCECGCKSFMIIEFCPGENLCRLHFSVWSWSWLFSEQ